MVPAGLRLNPPHRCPDVIKSLMMSCWKEKPPERICFELIWETLKRTNQKKVILSHRALYNRRKFPHYLIPPRNAVAIRINKIVNDIVTLKLEEDYNILKSIGYFSIMTKLNHL